MSLIGWLSMMRRRPFRQSAKARLATRNEILVTNIFFLFLYIEAKRTPLRTIAKMPNMYDKTSLPCTPVDGMLAIS
jgi:delta-aminolevulinic acid dehydratase/porphobilinogen synthase